MSQSMTADRKMDALVWHGGASVSLERVDRPRPAPGQVLADVRLAGLCGSDLHQYRGNPGPRRPPLVLGHEAVVAVAGNQQRFVVFPLVVCGDCEACARGEENLCRRRGLVGLDRPGVFAESLVVDKSALIPIPHGLDPLVAVLTEPQAASVSALRAEDADERTRLIVIGCGPIGLLAVHAAVHRGIHAVVADPVESRREVALRLGARHAVADVSALPPRSADIVLDAVGGEASWRGAIESARDGGAVVVLGLAQAEGPVPVGDLVRRGLSLRGHYAYTRGDFEAALSLLAEHPTPVDWLELAMVSDGADIFRRVVEAPDRIIKAILMTDVEAADRGWPSLQSPNAPVGAEPGAPADSAPSWP